MPCLLHLKIFIVSVIQDLPQLWLKKFVAVDRWKIIYYWNINLFFSTMFSIILQSNLLIISNIDICDNCSVVLYVSFLNCSVNFVSEFYCCLYAPLGEELLWGRFLLTESAREICSLYMNNACLLLTMKQHLIKHNCYYSDSGEVRGCYCCFCCCVVIINDYEDSMSISLFVPWIHNGQQNPWM